MRTTDDLRDELAARADALPGSPATTRLAAVRGRVRTARRRRTAAAALATAVVLGGGALTVHGLRSPEPVAPADGTVAGVDVPGTVDVLGFGYRLASVESVEDGDTVSLSGEQRAVVLVGRDLGGGSATLFVDDVALARVRGDQQVSVPVPTGEGDTDLEVRLDGTGSDAQAGVAVYESDGSLPPGVRDGDVVFRDRLAGLPLLDAGFAEPGASEVRLAPAGSVADMRFVPWCDGDDDLWVDVEVDGEPTLSSPCGSAPDDAASGSSTTLDGRRDPASTGAETHDVRAYLTRGGDGPAVTPPDDVTFGLGVYRRQAALERVLGTQVEQYTEYAGRTWTLADDAVLSRFETGDEDALLVLVGRGGRVTASWRGRLSRSSGTGASTSEGASTLPVGVLLAGDTYDITASGDETRLLVYRPVDGSRD